MKSELNDILVKLRRAETYISHCSMTYMPINVRELDGSISMHRPKSNEGHAYDEIREAINMLETVLKAGGDK
jgi:hypothetical protein